MSLSDTHIYSNAHTLYTMALNCGVLELTRIAVRKGTYKATSRVINAGSVMPKARLS
jgi:hypothetical protein